jgi:hypothetical protein
VSHNGVCAVPAHVRHAGHVARHDEYVATHDEYLTWSIFPVLLSASVPDDGVHRDVFFKCSQGGSFQSRSSVDRPSQLTSSSPVPLLKPVPGGQQKL